MAKSGHSGYPLKWFKDQSFARSFFECAICLEVLKDPVQVRDCGHQFCGLCIEDILKTNPRCPSCRITISRTVIFKDNAANRLIRKLDVNCPNDECSWRGNLSSFLEVHVNNCSIHVRRASNNNVDVRRLEEQFEIRLKSEISAVKQKYENEMKELKSKHEKDIQGLKEEINHLRSFSYRSGRFLMKISNFSNQLWQSKHTNRNIMATSDPFFSSEFGYKMKILVKFNERDRGFTGYMGVYLILMKSDHDGILSWPFDKSCTISLIDQQEEEWYRQDHTWTLYPRGEDAFERPEQAENAGCGWSNFIAHSKLRTRNYIKDNVVFIRFDVES